MLGTGCRLQMGRWLGRGDLTFCFEHDCARFSLVLYPLMILTLTLRDALTSAII